MILLSHALLRMLPVVALALCCLGCGEPDAPPPTAEEIGSWAKKDVQEFIVAVQADPAVAADRLPTLLESMKAYSDNSAGPKKLAYTKLTRTLKELEQMYAEGAFSGDIDAKLEELSAQAADLPGTVEPQETI